ncbi:MAG TPA: hypothetical protein VLK85_02415 [Ramlibacter sp.]|nr:hypothetical protein [Ramlibacter sp.]
MNLLTSPRFLRTVLWLDAASAAACGALQLAGAGWLTSLLGLSDGLLRASGLVLLAVAAWAAVLARRPVPAGVRALALVNGAWVLACLGLLVAGGAGTVPGQLYVLMQLVAVAVLAELQWFALRRQSISGWA